MEFRAPRKLNPGQFPGLELCGAPIAALLTAVPYLRPGIIKRCKRFDVEVEKSCKMYLTGWDRRDYCSESCHPKREYDPSRVTFHKVYREADRWAATWGPGPEIRQKIGKKYGKEYADLKWKAFQEVKRNIKP